MSSVTPPQLQLEQVSLTDGRGLHFLLQDISLAVYPGDRWGIVGPSGSGKTSLLRLLNRLSEPTSGTIYLQGQAIGKLPSLNLRQRVMLVPQEPRLLGMTVQEALTYPLRLRGLPPTTIDQRLEALINQFQLPRDWLGRSEIQLSVGQRQLVAIARALGPNPEILLLDEPTSALDTGRIEHLTEVFAQYPQTTLILASHQLDLVRQVCDRVVQLQQGVVVQNTKTTALDWEQLRLSFRQQEQLITNEWS